MRRLPALLLLIGGLCATTAAAGDGTVAPVGPAASITPAQLGLKGLPGKITEAALQPNWYTPANRSAAFQVSGTGGTCGVQAVFDRREDGEHIVVPFGALKLPWQGAGVFGDPFQLGPGTYDVTVNGAPVGSPETTPGCTGSVKVGHVVADEKLLGKNFPKIGGASWEGPTKNGAAVLTDHNGAKFLDVQIVNYLDGFKWTPQSKTMVNPVCAVTVQTTYAIVDIHGAVHDMNVTWSDQYSLVLAANGGGTPVYRGQVITPGPGGATWKVNVPEMIRKFQFPSKGEIWTVQVKSTTFNRGMEAPCIGSATAKMVVD